MVFYFLTLAHLKASYIEGVKRPLMSVGGTTTIEYLPQVSKFPKGNIWARRGNETKLAYIYLVTVLVLDELDGIVDTGCFGH
jgi:hypothetical protein